MGSAQFAGHHWLSHDLIAGGMRAARRSNPPAYNEIFDYCCFTRKS